MHARKSDLALGGVVQRMDIFQARNTGAVPMADLKQPQSLVQRIKARKQAEREAEQKKSKRQRRREFDAKLAAAKAKGEV